MKLRVAAGILLGACLIAGCRQADMRTAAIHVPGMQSQACANLILRQLATEQGINPAQVAVRLEARTVEVRYDSLKQSMKNLEYAIADLGFAANDIPANAEAQSRLPAGCR